MTQNVASYITAIATAVSTRAAYEADKNASNESIRSLLVTSKNCLLARFTNEALATVMLQSNVNADFINRQERSNNRYNVYAAQKVENAVSASLSTEALNHYSLAILRAVCKLTTITHKDAVSLCSESVKHSDAKREKAIKSLRYAKHVAATTASTQSSSSLNALLTCNILCESRDANNDTVYTLNADSVMFAKLASQERYAEMFAIAASE